MTYPGQRVQVGVKAVPCMCIADPELRLFQYTAIDEFTSLRFLAAYPKQSTYSSTDFLKKIFKWYVRRGIRVECVQTDNGFEFTNRFSNSKWDVPTLFEVSAAEMDIRHKLIHPYTPCHNGKVERRRHGRTRNAGTPAISFTPGMTFLSSSLSITAALTTFPLDPSTGFLILSSLPICLTNLQ